MTLHRSRTSAAALLGAAALAVVLSACSGASSSGAATPAATTPSASSPAAPSSTAASPSEPAQTSSSPAAKGQLVELAVAKNKVTGPRGRVKVKLGSTVTLRVTSDVADEVHLHGYDEHADVTAGGTVDLTFTANVLGVFEVELESRALQLTQLQVQ